MKNTNEATRYLAHWAATVSADWSDEVLALARDSLADTIVSTVAGAGDTGAAITRRSFPADGPVPIVGGMHSTSAPLAALVNGYSAHAVEMDDNFFIAAGHFGCVVIPALLAVGWENKVNGRQLLDALIVGSEVMARLGSAIGRAHTNKGWHGTSTLGSIAAAAACARLLKLDSARMTHAISLAVSMSAGPKVQFGTPAKPLHAGLAAQAGVLAAQLASHGLSGSDSALEGAMGFGDLYAGVVPADWSALDLNDDGRLAIQTDGFAFKKYPACGSTHRAIDGLLSLMAQYQFKAEDVKKVITKVGLGNIKNLRYPNPLNHKEAQFSMQYCIALALRFGTLTLADFTPDAVNDVETRKLLPLVDMIINPEFENRQETVRQHFPHTVDVFLKDGRQYTTTVQHAKGTLENPFTLQDKREKFDSCCKGILPADRLETLWRVLENPLEILEIRNLMDLLVFDAGGGDDTRFRRFD